MSRPDDIYLMRKMLSQDASGNFGKPPETCKPSILASFFPQRLAAVVERETKRKSRRMQPSLK